mmetsp:Transcript_49950/g.83180  ORF Transcript_49950/g.83180 Transcript_49950/m.83180 type:complete len:453 (+) Transcript_49950:78-1436(+)
MTKLPTYQQRQNKMLSVYREYETRPLYLVCGFVRALGIESIEGIIIPQDLINLCFKFFQHEQIAKLLDTKDCDELYTIAWDATEKEEYLFAEQLVAYLLNPKNGSFPHVSNHFSMSAVSNANPGSNNSSAILSATVSNSALDNTLTTRIPTPTATSSPKRHTYTLKSSDSDSDERYCEMNLSEDASTANLMAVIKYFQKNTGESELYFRMARTIDPHCDIILNNYAVLLLEQERYGDAERAILDAIACNPQCIKNHQQYAYILFTMGRYQDAAKQCQYMIELQPDIESYSGYAWLLEQMGQYDESLLQYERLIALEPDNAVWYFWYAVLLQRCDRFYDSLHAFKTCVEMDADYETGNANYAYSLYMHGQHDLALQYIQIALSKACDAKHLCVHFYHALILIEHGQLQTAVNELYQCLDLIQLQTHNRCKRETGCLHIQEGHIYQLLTELGYN